jgi:hypothetical protein
MTDRAPLHRSYRIAGRVCVISLAPLRGDAGELRWIVDWLPGPPPRMLPEHVAAFDEAKRLTAHAIRTQLEGNWGS